MYIILYIGWLLYYLLVDPDSFYIAIPIGLLFGFLLWLAFKSRNSILRAFIALLFFGQAVSTPYFWMNRSTFYENGWRSVGYFQFEEIPFILIFLKLFSITFFIICTILLFEYLQLDTLAVESKWKEKGVDGAKKNIGPVINLFDYLLLFLIFLVLIPINWYLGSEGIGLLGMEARELPFHIIGIIFYLRLLVCPIILLVIYLRSTKNILMNIAIFSYAFIAGVSSASRTVLIASLSSLIISNIFGTRLKKIIFPAIIILFIYFYVSVSRDYLYEGGAFDLIGMSNYVIEKIVNGEFSIIDIVGGLSNRLYGPQYFVLADQYSGQNSFEDAYKYIMSGGDSAFIASNISYDLFGLSLEDTNFGVGMGLLPSFLILINSNFKSIYLLLTFLIISIIIGNELINKLINQLIKNFSIIKDFNSRNIFNKFFSCVFAYFLYSGSINYCYYFIEILFIGLIIIESIPLFSKGCTDAH